MPEHVDTNSDDQVMPDLYAMASASVEAYSARVRSEAAAFQ